jgi:hypothetical protein
MRTARPKPKKLTQVNVPMNLREFLRKVATLIESRDESAMVLSDDLLQGDRTSGGLIDDRAGEYGFTYFPGDGVRTKWELQLTATRFVQSLVAASEGSSFGRARMTAVGQCSRRQTSCASTATTSTKGYERCRLGNSAPAEIGLLPTSRSIRIAILYRWSAPSTARSSWDGGLETSHLTKPEGF